MSLVKQHGIKRHGQPSLAQFKLNFLSTLDTNERPGFDGAVLSRASDRQPSDVSYWMVSIEFHDDDICYPYEMRTLDIMKRNHVLRLMPSLRCLKSFIPQSVLYPNSSNFNESNIKFGKSDVAFPSWENSHTHTTPVKFVFSEEMFSNKRRARTEYHISSRLKRRQTFVFTFHCFHGRCENRTPTCWKTFMCECTHTSLLFQYIHWCGR